MILLEIWFYVVGQSLNELPAVRNLLIYLYEKSKPNIKGQYMMKKLSIDIRVNIYGSNKEISQAEQAITASLPELSTMDEPKARLSLQWLIDSQKIKTSILINGNTVYSFSRITRDVRKVKKNGMTAMTDYLYKFLSLDCGSIAHYSRLGWIDVYPTVEHLRKFFLKNEFGHRVLHSIPAWKTDAIVIVEEIESILRI